ncbi:capping protein inhibiting regulator of actin dynamics [Triplophysa rosa]|uniref:DUF4592 domain-containing protein n=1 Tax=Triplophysa rosa TaxID=992332 RepID=A0A9W7TNK5_TRIRA|nr:capping protein inhibiting regulator of actin dynamics [Triplophysa rosa]KAI7799613.1 hypothetical protein IRJ41_007367 [Triplophysa rosa]
MSQENVSDKVRNIQKQIGHNIKFGQRPPSLRKSEGDEGSSDEEDVPQSPLRVLAQVESEPLEPEAKEKATSHDPIHHRTPVKSPRTKRPPPPGTIESINLDAVPQFVPCLDNTAAKHKLSVKPKNQRVSRKHRRFTQEVDLSEMQEETETQKHEDVFDLTRKDIHRSKEDYEPTEKSIRKRLQNEEQEHLEPQRREQEEERKNEEQWTRIEEQRLEEDKLRRQEQMQKEEEQRKAREEEKKREEEEKLRLRLQEERKKKEELERKKQEEEKKKKEEEEKKRIEEGESIRKEEEERRRAEKERRQQELKAEQLRLEEERKREQEEKRRKEEVAAEKHRIQELEEKRQREEEQRLHEEERRRQGKEAEEKKREEGLRKKQQQEQQAAEEQAKVTDPEWKRKAEELRWREMEERQRPFTFKVSSGEKQILFQKVNLTPVTPATGQQDETRAETREGAKASSPGCTESPTLSSSLYVPHTAILVTGAQLCGTAVNLDQIKDTACKSLLGLSEGKKAMGTPPTKSKTSPDRKSGKTKSLHESSLSVDQSNAAVLAEWASIRSKILKGAEEGKYPEYPDQSHKQSQSRPVSEDLNTVPFSHTNLRKTMSASAKFSITPARKKFADSNRNSEVFSQEEREGGKVESASTESPPVPKELPSSGTKIQNRGSKVVRITDSSEECMFAKDLPSFLVPSPSHESPSSQISETRLPSQAESQDFETKDEGDQKDQSGDEQPSPFGIKLRRTNYSLRFHNEQSAEKRKKRYSAGDSFEGVPVPLTSIDQDSDTSTLSEKTSSASPQQEIAGYHTAVPSKEPRIKFGRSTLSSRNEGDNFVPKPPRYQKPAASPKPSEGATPPLSPFPKHGKRTSGDMISQTTEAPGQIAAEQSRDHKEDISPSVQSQRNGQGEDEVKEKKSFFPSISIPWREKTDRRTELIKREKPSLQARHSLDSSRTQEKEIGPLWITMALQKQKGFREQQQSREERRSQREAKLAEKQARERESVGMVSPTEDKGNFNSSPPKQTAPEHKRPDTLLARFERRDNLKKANTLPSSVTVEITDPTPSPPATKDVTKRFPPGDTTQVSTEPAWLALAKRKAKAWSDCPQIIK